MATYRQIQNWIKNKYGFSVKTCWIAHAKEIFGLNPRIAHNRYNPKERKHPCPKQKLQPIREAFKHFEIIE